MINAKTTTQIPNKREVKMKSGKRRTLFVVVTLVVVGIIGWSIAAVVIPQMDEQMQMMKQKMMKRGSCLTQHCRIV